MTPPWIFLAAVRGCSHRGLWLKTADFGRVRRTGVHPGQTDSDPVLCKLRLSFEVSELVYGWLSSRHRLERCLSRECEAAWKDRLLCLIQCAVITERVTILPKSNKALPAAQCFAEWGCLDSFNSKLQLITCWSVTFVVTGCILHVGRNCTLNIAKVFQRR